MASNVLWALLLAAVPLAGCVEPDISGGSDPVDVVAPVLAPPLEAALWNDPQQFPHPAYGWPTLTHVPAAAPDWWQPIPARPLPAEIQGLEHLATAGAGHAGDGIAVFGRLAVNPAGKIYDLTDPEQPTVLGTMKVQPAARQAVLIPFPDGRLYAAFATGSGNIPIWDITDPRSPDEVAIFDVPSGGHTIAVVPGTPILYNANAVGSRYYPHELSGGRSVPQVEIYDLSKPDDPDLVLEWKNGYGCHAISFYLNAAVGKLRAYCAAVDATQIWDVEDPLAPKIIATVPMPHGQAPLPGYPILAAVSHWVVVNDDATVMAVADEFLGGAGPGCDAYVRNGDRTVSGPAGNVYFYDVSDETKPALRGWVNPGAHFTYNPPPQDDGSPGSCTAHIGRMIPQPEKDLLAMSFYAGGVALIDFTDAASPFIVDKWAEAEPMDVWYYNGYLFAGDASHGLDVLTLA